MTAHLDRLLTARHVLISDHVIALGQHRPGHPGQLTAAAPLAGRVMAYLARCCPLREGGLRLLDVATKRGEDPMPNLVCTGATLQCSFGTIPSTFAASGAETSASSPAGVVTDMAPANVPPFGLCTAPSNPQVAAAKAPQPCLPVLAAPWQPGSTRVTISGASALDDSCSCTCTWGGVVTVSTAGQIAASDQ